MANFKPFYIISDYCLPQLNALKKTFKNSLIFGCHFHFLKAIRINLKEKSNFSSEIRKEIFILIKNEVISSSIANIEQILLPFKEIDRFLHYFKKTWINRFPSHYWDFFFRKEIIKIHSTNNYVESHFNQLKRVVGIHNKCEFLVEKLFNYSLGIIKNKLVFNLFFLFIY